MRLDEEIAILEKEINEDEEFKAYCLEVCEKINKKYPDPKDIKFDSFEEGLTYMLSNMKEWSSEDVEAFCNDKEDW